MNIFEGIEEDKREALLKCVRAVKKTYISGQPVFNTGDKVSSLACIISGSVQIIQEDYSGNKIIISVLKEGESFAEALACKGSKASPVGAVAVSNSEILFLNFGRILKICTNTCEFHQRLIKNITNILAEKNLYLQHRLELLSKKQSENEFYFSYIPKAKRIIHCHLKYHIQESKRQIIYARTEVLFRENFQK